MNTGCGSLILRGINLTKIKHLRYIPFFRLGSRNQNWGNVEIAASAKARFTNSGYKR